jgi:hypothetical protein
MHSGPDAHHMGRCSACAYFVALVPFQAVLPLLLLGLRYLRRRVAYPTHRDLLLDPLPSLPASLPPASVRLTCPYRFLHQLLSDPSESMSDEAVVEVAVD